MRFASSLRHVLNQKHAWIHGILKMRPSKYWAIVSMLCLILVAANFLNNGPFIVHFQQDSDCLVWGKIFYSDVVVNGPDRTGLIGVFSNGDFVRINNLIDVATGAKQHCAIIAKSYYSQFGLLGYTCEKAWVVWKTFGGNAKYFVVMGYMLSVIFAMMLAIIVAMWFNKEMGRLASTAFLLCWFGSKWILAMAGSMYWALWTWFLPMVIAMLYVRKKRSPGTAILLILQMTVLMTIRFLCGYEFASAIAISAMSPIVYVGFRDQWTLMDILKHIIWVFAASIVSFALAISMHIVELYNILGSCKDALHRFMAVIAKRGGSAAVVNDYKDVINASEMRAEIQSLAVPLHRVLAIYIFQSGTWMMLSVFTVIVLSICFGLLLAKLRLYINKSIYSPEIVTVIIFSCAGPLSWIILMRGHAYIHQHIDFVLWYVPFLLWLFPCVGLLVEEAVRSQNRK